jgi:uncharacterized protein YjeT (DUF2065 family)
MADLITALGLAMAIEGTLYALFPGAMRRMMAMVLGQPEGQLRAAGLAALVLGVCVVWLVRG